MNKPIKRSFHLLTIVAICICSMIFITCCGLIYTMDNAGLMYVSGNTLKTMLMDQAAYDYTVWAISDRDGDFNADFMEEKGCNIAVVEGEFEHLKDLDLSDDKTFVFKNFEGDLPAEYYTTSVYVSDGSEYSLSEKMYDFLFEETNYIYDNYDYYQESKDIKGIGYDMVGQCAYVWDGEKFYRLSDSSYSYTLSDEGGTYNTTNIYDRIWASQVPSSEETHSFVPDEEQEYSYSDETTIVIEDSSSSLEENADNNIEKADNNIEKAEASSDIEEENTYLPAETITTTSTPTAGSPDNGKVLYIDGVAYSPLGTDDSNYVLELDGFNSSGALALSNVADLTDLHDQLRDSDIETCSLETVSTVNVSLPGSTDTLYTVFSFPGENQASDSFFAQASRYLRLIPVLHILLPVLAVVSALLLIVFALLLVVRAGQYENKRFLNTDILARFPMEVTFILACIAEILPGYLIAYAINFRWSADLEGFFILGLGSAIAILIGTLWFESVVINFKSGHFYKNTLCYKFLRWIARPFRYALDAVVTIMRSVKWSNRIFGICAVIIIAEFMGIVTIDNKRALLLFWFVEKVILALVLVKVLIDYSKVKSTAVEMAAGNMDASVNTKGMFIDLEEHGEALNEIASGLNTAISERMKSERMKTELITNVSHDIKTPLTSVINYVDLLQKEDFENETARGYLEVLDRQAKRLKKLIEDLIEASKAATGSIKFNIENVNARVLLNQSIGEFDDRLTDKNILVITEVPENDIYVKADNRYLFRVFDNLMSNIVKYSQEGTRAYVELKEKDGRAQYTFKNISREKLNISADELMERFVRGDLSRNTEGNGLGLSIARSLTESMGGRMELTVDGDLFKVDVSFPEELGA